MNVWCLYNFLNFLTTFKTNASPQNGKYKQRIFQATLTLTSSSFSSSSSVSVLFCFFHFILRFWNQTFTCFSASPNATASSIRRLRVRYLLNWNSFSSSVSCDVLKLVRNRLNPSRSKSKRKSRRNFVIEENVIYVEIIWRSLSAQFYLLISCTPPYFNYTRHMDNLPKADLSTRNWTQGLFIT